MRKFFNITGSCNPERHYMVDSPERFAAVERLIDGGNYFTINRARQYGKTTTLQTIRRRLSDKYLIIDTSFEGVGDRAFHSVVLAGVYDVKNLKLKLRPDEERKYNSPWNIAADFNVDMTFHPEEIAQMLGDYERDVHTGMDIQAVSKEIYRYTNGYPFLVSKLCKVIDEDLNQDWTTGGVQNAAKATIFNKNTLFTSLTKNLETYPELKRFVYSLSMLGDTVTYDPNNPVMDFATMFSIIKYDTNRKVSIHNIIFEEVLNNYFIAEQNIADMGKLRPMYNYVKGDQLDMEFVLRRFRDLMHEEYRKEDDKFKERQGRLIFLSFLKPIINGTGFYYVEPQTRDNRRMDLIVTYGSEEFILELKIWRGDKYEQTGREQLSEYLTLRGKDKGYLLTFDFSKNKQDKEPEWVEVNGKRIFEVVVV